jgi:hypothetical protein
MDNKTQRPFSAINGELIIKDILNIILDKTF